MTTHGIKGEVKVKNFSDFDRYQKRQKLYVLHEGKYEELVISHAKQHPKGMYLGFEGYNDINLIQKYHGDELYISEDDREELEDEYYYSDLIGKKVLNQNKEERGVVIDILDYPQGSILVIEYNGSRKTVPYRDEFIIEIDEFIHVQEIEGLF